MTSVNIDDFIVPHDQPVVDLDCSVAFNNLTDVEKKYAHYLSKASYDGGLIVLVQTSPESPPIYVLLHKLLSAEPLEDFKLRAGKSGASESDIQAVLVYACGIFTYMGNYKGMGDSKIVPNLSPESFEGIITSSKAYEAEPQILKLLWESTKKSMYSLNLTERFLGFSEKGTTTYFTPNCTQKDSDLVGEYLKSAKLGPYNNRVFKTIENGKTVYEIRMASVLSEPGDEPFLVPETVFNDCVFRVTRGDYSPLLNLVNENLKIAQNFVSNETEKKMIDEYIKSFHTGSLEAHINGSRHWIKDKGPVIETYIGFIETYRDPAGVRGEFEGFVAMVNKEVSAKYAVLVAGAEKQLEELPWPPTFEKDVFLKPDFTSLDVLSFAGSGIPCGINIPNYDEVRQDEGFKNVSLGNVIPAAYKQTKIAFLSEEDIAILDKYRIPSFEVQVALHELLGHGSGKLFCRGLDGKFNFDPETVINPLTGEKIKSWYEAGESYDSQFSTMSSSYEECRAECVGLYLCFNRDVLRLFDIKEDEEEDVIYANWLSLLSNGSSKALEMYQPSAKSWLQAHAQARYVILRVCMEAGEGFVTVTETEPGKDLRLTVDRSKLHTVGKKAVGDFLLKLQVYKATGDVKAARAMYDKYSEVPEDGPQPWAKWRDIILAHKQPRKMFAQANTSLQGDEVKLTTYPGTVDGLIQSWIDRFPDNRRTEALLALWKKDAQHYPANSQ